MTIPVYTQPSTAAKPSGTTPQTSASQPQTTSGSNTAPSITTAAPTSSYPPARPGAVPPAPTAASQRYAPVQPTPTTTQIKTDSPAPPQPGVVPTPFGSSTIPPPPKAGQIYQAAQQTASPLAQPYPPQMSIPPPTSTYGQPPHSSTATTTTPLVSYPASIAEVSAPRRSLEHPPGYQQNVYASEMTSDQRRAQEAANYSQTTEHNTDTGAGLDTESVWNSAKKLVQQAGEKIQEAEAEVWRKINKE